MLRNKHSVYYNSTSIDRRTGLVLQMQRQKQIMQKI